MTRETLYQHEIEAVERIRKAYPDMAQRALARVLTSLTADGTSWFAYTSVAVDALRVRSPYATVYNRIRRFDKKQKELALAVTQGRVRIDVL